jgi:hypothetical protein
MTDSPAPRALTAPITFTALGRMFESRMYQAAQLRYKGADGRR